MKLFLYTFGILLVSGFAAQAQRQMTKEETLQYLSEQLGEIQAEAAQLQQYYPTFTSNDPEKRSYLQDRIDDLLEKAVDVRDYLSGNSYIQVSGFSVMIPWGITFEFAFPTASDTTSELPKASHSRSGLLGGGIRGNRDENPNAP